MAEGGSSFRTAIDAVASQAPLAEAVARAKAIVGDGRRTNSPPVVAANQPKTAAFTAAIVEEVSAHRRIKR